MERLKQQGGCPSNLITHWCEVWFTFTGAYGEVKHIKCLTCGLIDEKNE